jgi:LCP family protein required for cell wall assembly
MSVVCVALIGAVGLTYVMRAFGHIDRYGVDVDGGEGGVPENFLVVGSDSRAESTGSDQAPAGQRSDTIMIVRTDPANDSASVLALPRDLVVPISGTRETTRINAAYNQGRQTLIDTIRDNFDIEINHYVEIDFQGFQRLVDAVGGIPLYLETAIKDTQSGLYVEDLGCVTLDGEQALAYARSRHLQYMTDSGRWSRPDPTADLGRIQRQQVFIRRALALALAEAKSNPLRLRDLLDIGTSSVGVDGDTDPMALVRQFRGFDTSQLATYSLPVVPRSDGATLSIDEAAAGPVLALFRDPPEDEKSKGDDSDEDDDRSGDAVDPDEVAAVDPASVTVTVLNGTTVNGRARDAAAVLGSAGFNMAAPGDAPNHNRTTIYYAEGERALAARVAQHVTGPVSIERNTRYADAPGEVAVVAGQDFVGIEREPRSPDAAPSGPPPPPQTEPTDYTVGEPPAGMDCG